MMTIFSARTRTSTWRQLWVWLAEAEKELGLDISDEALTQMRAHVTVTDEAFVVANEYEKKFRVSSLFYPAVCLSQGVFMAANDGVARCYGPCARLW